MRNALMCLMVALLAGCSSSPESTSSQSKSHKRSSRFERAVKREAQRLGAPSQSLSAFRNFELNPMEVSADVSARKEKAEAIKELEDKIRARLLPLIEEWKSDETSLQTSDTLIIKPKLETLRIIKLSTRVLSFGEGGGDSIVDMDITMIDGKTGTVIANPRIRQTAHSAGGSWSNVASDKNLLDYTVEILYQYLVDNYKK